MILPGPSSPCFALRLCSPVSHLPGLRPVCARTVPTSSSSARVQVRGICRSNGVPALAAHVGGGATASSIDHRLRPIKQLGKMQANSLKRGEDPGGLPVEKSGKAALLPLSPHPSSSHLLSVPSPGRFTTLHYTYTSHLPRDATTHKQTHLINYAYIMSPIRTLTTYSLMPRSSPSLTHLHTCTLAHSHKQCPFRTV